MAPKTAIMAFFGAIFPPGIILNGYWLKMMLNIKNIKS